MSEGAILFVECRATGFTQAMLDDKCIGMSVPYDGPGRYRVAWFMNIGEKKHKMHFAVDQAHASADMERVALDHVFMLKQKRKLSRATSKEAAETVRGAA